MRAIGYVRVSTDEQVEHGVSLDAQRSQILGYAQLYGLDIVEVISDEGVSAASLDRAGLQRALKRLTDGDAQALVVAKLDRLTRSLRDLLDLLNEYFGARYSLLSVAEQLDPRTASGRLVLNILAAVAQWERETISERTRAALRHKRSKGEFTGGEVPYGWKRGEAGMLASDEREQLAIARAQELRANGLSYRKIGEALARDSFLSRNGTVWVAQQVKRLCRVRWM
jgi:site-specific DNA recombinase